MSNNDIRNEIEKLYYTRGVELVLASMYDTPAYMSEAISEFSENLKNHNDIKDSVSRIINIGKQHSIPIESIFAIIISTADSLKIDYDELANICIDIETEYRENKLRQTNNPDSSVTNQPIVAIDQPIAAKNMGFDPSAFIRQPQSQQPNMVMGQMYNPTTFIATPQSVNTVQGGNASHGNNCQCPECKGSPYWNNMNDSDKINFIKQHYELLDIHKRNVSSDEVNALINLIKNPDTINRLIKLGYTGDGSSLRLKEVPPAKYNEYGKGIFNRYYEVPVGSNNIVICYNTKGELNADGYMMYTLQVKRDSELK